MVVFIFVFVQQWRPSSNPCSRRSSETWNRKETIQFSEKHSQKSAVEVTTEWLFSNSRDRDEQCAVCAYNMSVLRGCLDFYILWHSVWPTAAAVSQSVRSDLLPLPASLFGAANSRRIVSLNTVIAAFSCAWCTVSLSIEVAVLLGRCQMDFWMCSASLQTSFRYLGWRCDFRFSNFDATSAASGQWTPTHLFRQLVEKFFESILAIPLSTIRRLFAVSNWHVDMKCSHRSVSVLNLFRRCALNLMNRITLSKNRWIHSERNLKVQTQHKLA
jgi:hypothetical protein